MIVSPIFWVMANILISLCVSVMSVYMLRHYFHVFYPPERIAIGLIGAGSFMRAGPLYARNVLGENSPFDDWSTLLVSAGLLLLMICWVRRLEVRRLAQRG